MFKAVYNDIVDNNEQLIIELKRLKQQNKSLHIQLGEIYNSKAFKYGSDLIDLKESF